MNKLFLLFSGVVGCLTPILCFFDLRKYVLYLFVLLIVLSPIIWGYMDQTGLLSLTGGKIWSVLDIQLICLILIAWPLSQKNTIGRQSSGVDTAIWIMSALIVLNFFVGVARLGGLGGVLNIFRNFMSLPVYFAASVILAKPDNVKQFYRWVMWFCLFVFLVHVVIAFKIYSPALYLTTLEKSKGLEYRQVFRSSIYMFEPFYLVAACVSVCHLLYGRKKNPVAWAAFFASLLGTALTQARGMYGAFALIVVGLFFFTKFKIRSILIIAVGAVFSLGAFLYSQSKGVDIFYRFTHGRTGGFYESVRGSELSNVVSSFLSTPMAILTGQGFGVAVAGTQGTVDTIARGYFHNDYLGALFSLGIIGLVCYCYILWSSIFRGRHYCYDPELALLIMPARLFFFAIAGYAQLNQTFWLFKGMGLLMAMLAVSRNCGFYAQQLYDENLLSENGLSELQEND
jgi:hypothetical protein